MQTAAETANVLRTMLDEAKITRARISEKTIKRLSQRPRIRHLFLSELLVELDDRGIALIELNRGGFGLLKFSVLDGAPPLVPEDT